MSSDTKTKTGGFLGSLKSAFFEEETGQPAPAATQPAPQQTPTRPPPSPMYPTGALGPRAPFGNPVVDPAVMASLERFLATNAAANYRDFVEQLATLSAVIPDEAACYRAALALLAKKGITTAQLVEEFTASAQMLMKHNEQFHAECEQQITKKVGGRQQAVSNLDAQIQQREDQIRALQNEIAQLSQQRSEQASGIEAERMKITEVAQKFTVAFDAMMASLGERKTKIMNYGRG